MSLEEIELALLALVLRGKQEKGCTTPTGENDCSEIDRAVLAGT